MEMKINLTRLRIILLGFVVLVALSAAPLSYAQGSPTGPTAATGGYVCDPAKFSILKLLNSFSTSIVSTALTHNEALSSIKPFYMMVGMSPAEQQGCLNYLADNGGLPTCFANAVKGLNCPDTEAKICESLMNQYQTTTGSGYRPQQFAQSKVSGSLLGYTYFVQNTMNYEPVPVNTAYFFKDYAAKLPIVGETVYAQNVTDYGHTLINAILNMWKVFRNIAYALMAIIMLWVGFAIISRKRISSQTVVNVQYALPKIVIALVFIALSYPIGALITSFSWTLFHSSSEIIMSITGNQRPVANDLATCGFANFGSAIGAVNNVGIGGLMALLGTISIYAAGAGAFIGLIGFTEGIVIVFLLFAYIKAFWIYFKMVMSTATAPLQIALYALPGNDDKLELWLKQMIAWGAGMFGMALILNLVQAFAIDLIFQVFTPVLQGDPVIHNSIVSGSLYNVVLAPLMMIFGASLAIRIPNTIEDLIIGPKKGGKR